MRKTWLTTTEAAAALGLTQQTLWRWTRDGTIPEAHLLRSGRRTYVSLAFVRGQKAVTA